MKYSHNHYNKNLKTFSRQNRKKQTPAETIMWSRLRRKQILNLRFLRQRSIDNFIVDFLQPDLKLIIEIDGSSHDEYKYSYDFDRQKHLENLGYHFLRFTEHEVKTKLSEVLDTICLFCEKHLRTNYHPPEKT